MESVPIRVLPCGCKREYCEDCLVNTVSIKIDSKIFTVSTPKFSIRKKEQLIYEMNLIQEYELRKYFRSNEPKFTFEQITALVQLARSNTN